MEHNQQQSLNEAIRRVVTGKNTINEKIIGLQLGNLDRSSKHEEGESVTGLKNPNEKELRRFLDKEGSGMNVPFMVDKRGTLYMWSSERNSVLHQHIAGIDDDPVDVHSMTWGMIHKFGGNGEIELQLDFSDRRSRKWVDKNDTLTAIINSENTYVVDLTDQ